MTSPPWTANRGNREPDRTRSDGDIGSVLIPRFECAANQ